MPKTTSSGKPKQSELPSTLQRSPAKAQRTFAKAHDSAVETYGEGERAHRAAYSALKHSFEKRGDRPRCAGTLVDEQGRARRGDRAQAVT